MEKVKKGNFDLAIILSILVGSCFALTYVAKLGYYYYFNIPSNYITADYKDILFFSGLNILVIVSILMTIFQIINPDKDYLNKMKIKIDKVRDQTDDLLNDIALNEAKVDKVMELHKSNIPIPKGEIRTLRKEAKKNMRRGFWIKLKASFNNFQFNNKKKIDTILTIFYLILIILFISLLLISTIQSRNYFLLITIIFQVLIHFLTVMFVYRKNYIKLGVVCLFLIPYFFSSGYSTAFSKNVFYSFEYDNKEYIMVETFNEYLISKELSENLIQAETIHLFKQEDVTTLKKIKLNTVK